MNRSPFAILLAVSLFLAACGRPTPAPAPVPGPSAGSTPTAAANVPATPLLPETQPSPTAVQAGLNQEEEVRAEYQNAFTSIPGLYLPAGSILVGSSENASAFSSLPCSAFLSALASGEWSLARSVSFPWLVGERVYFALLERGEQQILLRLLSQTFEAPSEEDLDLAEDGLPAVQAGVAGEEYCTAVLMAASVQTVRASGAENIEGAARQLPLSCTPAGDMISMELFYEGPGDLRILVEFSVPEASGEYQLSFVIEDDYADYDYDEEADPQAEDLPLEDRIVNDLFISIFRSKETYMEAFEKALEQGEAGSDDEDNLYFPAYEGFSGLLRVDPRGENSAVISGELQLTNLEHVESGRLQNLQIGFRCSLRQPSGD